MICNQVAIPIDSQSSHLIQQSKHALAPLVGRVNLVHGISRLAKQLRNDSPRVLEAACALHVSDGVALHVLVGRLLLEDVEELEVCGVRLDAVDDGEGELALGQVLSKALLLSILVVAQVLVVVGDLKDETQNLDERQAVDGRGGLGLHQSDG